MVRYSHAVDTRNWDLLDDIFTADATIDYSAMGGSKGSLAETKQFLADAMALFENFQHMIANCAIEVHGDIATGRTICHNPMLFPAGDTQQPRLLLCGLWYVDRFVRTPAGWRIAERVEEKSYMWAAPEQS